MGSYRTLPAYCNFPNCACVGTCTFAGYGEVLVDAPPRWRQLYRNPHPANGKRCPYCSRIMNDGHYRLYPTVDHVTPRCALGRDIASNRVAACAECNNAKGGYSIHEWSLLLAYRRDPRAAHVMAFIETHEASRQEAEALREAMAV